MTASTEVWLAVGYAGFLLAVSCALRWLARQTARGPWASPSGRRRRGADGPREEPSWPHCDAARFERGLSRVLEVLAVFLLAVTALRHPSARQLAVGALVFVVGLSHRLWLVRRLGHLLRRKSEESSISFPRG